MSLVKWLRKYNKKVMAIVVIVLMFGFIGGSSLTYISQSSGVHGKVAYFLNGKKITRYHLSIAQQELDTLRMLRADALLQNQDMLGILLGELLFSEQRTSPALVNHIRQMIGTNGYRISDTQISDIYERTMLTNVYWLLLTSEAELAGIRVANESVGRLLATAVPRLFGGITYGQMMRTVVNRSGISEKQILTAFGKLLAVLQYAHAVCATENVTNAQVLHEADWENETIDLEFVKFDPAVFAEDQAQPSQEKMAEQFDKFKGFLAGTVTQDNPHGFGYRLPDRVQLEYMAVKLSDVAPTTAPPKEEEIEEYYQRNRDLYTESTQPDPNDPNSPAVKRTKSYAEVAGEIAEQLRKDKIDAKADRMLQEARTLTEGLPADTGKEGENPSVEQLKQAAGDYKAAAEQLGKKYNLTVYSGLTGLLDAISMQNDELLSKSYLQGYGYYPVRLAKVVFAVDQLQASALGPFDAPKPRMYENLGPARNFFAQTPKETAGQIVAIFRIVAAEKTSEPRSIEQTFSTETVILDPNGVKTDRKVHSVKEKVAEDLKKLAAADVTRAKAREFIDMAATEGWENAVKKFNDLYGKQTKKDPNDPNTFKLSSISGLQRITSALLETLTAQSKGSPAAPWLINEFKTNRLLADQLFSLVPADSNTVETLPMVVEFKPGVTFYCLKSISVKRLWKEDFDKLKLMRLYREDDVQAQSMGPVFLNPENIAKRLSFKWIEEDRKPADANDSKKQKEAS